MTTVAQVKQVVQPLLQRNPDLALVGRMIVVRPVHHLLRGILSALEAVILMTLSPTRTLSTMFQPAKRIGFSWGDRVYAPDGKWDINDASLMAMMCEAIEKEALPLLRPIKTIDDFVKFTSRERFPHEYLDLYDLTKVFVDVARGDLAAAEFVSATISRPMERRSDI